MDNFFVALLFCCLIASLLNILILIASLFCQVQIIRPQCPHGRTQFWTSNNFWKHLMYSQTFQPLNLSMVEYLIWYWYQFKEGETERPPETFQVASMKVHQEWHPETLENDIAIIKLDGTVTRSWFRVFDQCQHLSVPDRLQFRQYASPRQISNTLTWKPMP